MTQTAHPGHPPRYWPVFRSFAGWGIADLPADLAAGLALAAIAIPEQMATSRLGGFTPEIGLYAFVAGAICFAVLGASRFLSAGADSTITPIFAGSLALLAATGSPHYAALAALLAFGVGAMLIAGGVLRMGWIANLLSIPVMTGFLAGIAVHIAASQLPALLALHVADGNLIQRLYAIGADIGRTNPYAASIGLGVLAVMLVSEKISPKIPGALVGLAGATVAVMWFGLEQKGVAVLGAVPAGIPHMAIPDIDLTDVIHVAALAFIVAIVVMVQTAATSRAFPDASGETDINRDYIGVGAGSVLAGLFGAFPVDASPPRTAVVSEMRGRSQATGLIAAAIVLVLIGVGPSLLHHVPNAALAGVLLAVAQRITRLSTLRLVFRQSLSEFALIVATMLAIVVLPIQTGVGIGIILSLLHGVWTTTRARAIEFERVPGTSIWWPPRKGATGEKLPLVKVIAFQAPLSFLNAYDFRRDVLAFLDDASPTPKLFVLEASSIVEIDFTAAQTLSAILDHCRANDICFAVARLESVRAQDALVRFGVMEKLGTDRLYHSVDEAVRALAPQPAR